mmetsp:Transcript_2534/g.7214  ORF Transcript_2534/g.7214 Transcript_2534/m.7214 type:complete len:250 (-) Transcript_2534:949-1698(-)
MVEKGTLFWSASCMSWFVGSTPGDSTKTRGDEGTESTTTWLRSSTGGSVKRWPRLLTMKDVTAKTMRSGRRQRTMMRRWSSVALFSHSPGNRAALVSGSGWRYQAFQSRGLEEKEAMIFLKLYSLSSSVMLSHAVSLTQSDTGLGGCCVRSKTWPPRRKKLYSSMFILRAPWRILAQIWKAKRSLCASKSPRHVLRYTKKVWYSLRCLMRSARSSDFGDFSREMLKRVTYESRLNWYMGSTRDRSFSMK